MNKLVVVIPALNEENLILKTLNSLSEQSKKDFSVIVVDNGSVDNTTSLVINYSKNSNFPILLIKETNKGVGYARHTGSLKGINMGAVYIAGTDADTILPINWIESIYNGFENNKYELLSGECDPFFNIKLKNDRAKLVLDARSLLFKNIKPYFRGANFAITSEMYIKAGGFIQPLTKEGEPAPGEDGALEKSSLQNGASIFGCLSTVFPHPRRYISNLININKFKGSVHAGGVVTEVRNESKLEKMLKDTPVEVLDTFVEKVSINLFNEFILEVYKEPVFRKIYWEKSLKLLFPFNRLEIENDIMESTDKLQIWNKYKETFFQNINRFVNPDANN